MMQTTAYALGHVHATHPDARFPLSAGTTATFRAQAQDGRTLGTFPTMRAARRALTRDRRARWVTWCTSSGRGSLCLPIDEARAVSAPGQCAAKVAGLLACDWVAAQVDAIGADEVRAHLGELGGWDTVELADDRANRARVLWVACGDLRDQETARP